MTISPYQITSTVTEKFYIRDKETAKRKQKWIGK